MPRNPKERTLQPGPDANPPRGNKPFIVTDAHRMNVSALVACGATQADICMMLTISLPTLHKHFRHELDTAMAAANAAVGQSLFAMATTGGNVAAAIFWAKVRMGWTETTRTELTGRNGAPIDLRAVASNATDDDLAAIAFGSGPALIAPPDRKN